MWKDHGWVYTWKYSRTTCRSFSILILLQLESTGSSIPCVYRECSLLHIWKVSWLNPIMSMLEFKWRKSSDVLRVDRKAFHEFHEFYLYIYFLQLEQSSTDRSRRVVFQRPMTRPFLPSYSRVMTLQSEPVGAAASASLTRTLGLG